MRILITGGGGDLGKRLIGKLLGQGDQLAVLDTAPRPADGPEQLDWHQGSITDRDAVEHACKGSDLIIHIAALHGIHLATGQASPALFHDVNVTGTFNLLDAAARLNCPRFLFISSSSVRKQHDVYGQSKLIGEEMLDAHVARHDMAGLVLRPRAFIPADNREVYARYIDWANWFAKGAVHITDMVQATFLGVTWLQDRPAEATTAPVPKLLIDGAYDFSPAELERWDAEGPGSSFAARYGRDAHDLARDSGLDVTRRPEILGSGEATSLIGFKPEFSMANVIDELKQRGGHDD